MTTTSTATVVDHTTDAGFRTWVAEIITALVTTCGLTQTADTGQINTGTATRPAANTSGGYSIFRFNDTLQATKPIFMRLDYGSGNGATNPQMWITLGTGSNGTGTITGTGSANKMPLCVGTGPSSTITSYTSRFVYNATYGYLAMVWKISGTGTTNVALGGLVVCRSNDTTGAATGDAIISLTNNYAGQNGVASGGPYMQCISTLTSLVYPPTTSNGALHGAFTNSSSTSPFGVTTTSYLGNNQIWPIYYMSPVFSFSAYMGAGLISEVSVGSTFTCTIVGTTNITLLSVGWPWGYQYIAGMSSTTIGYHILWQ